MAAELSSSEQYTYKPEYCYHCRGYYGPCFGEPLCATCHAFLYPADPFIFTGLLQLCDQKADEIDSGNEEPRDSQQEYAMSRFAPQIASRPFLYNMLNGPMFGGQQHDLLIGELGAVVHDVVKQDAMSSSAAQEVVKQDAMNSSAAQEVVKQDAMSSSVAQNAVKQRSHVSAGKQAVEQDGMIISEQEPVKQISHFNAGKETAEQDGLNSSAAQEAEKQRAHFNAGKEAAEQDVINILETHAVIHEGRCNRDQETMTEATSEGTGDTSANNATVSEKALAADNLTCRTVHLTNENVNRSEENLKVINRDEKVVVGSESVITITGSGSFPVVVNNLTNSNSGNPSSGVTNGNAYGAITTTVTSITSHISTSAGSAHGAASSAGSAHGAPSSAGSAHGATGSAGSAHGAASSAGSAHGAASSAGSAHGAASSAGSAHGAAGSAGSAHGAAAGAEHSSAPLMAGEDNWSINGRSSSNSSTSDPDSAEFAAIPARVVGSFARYHRRRTATGRREEHNASPDQLGNGDIGAVLNFSAKPSAQMIISQLSKRLSDTSSPIDSGNDLMNRTDGARRAVIFNRQRKNHNRESLMEVSIETPLNRRTIAKERIPVNRIPPKLHNHLASRMPCMKYDPCRCSETRTKRPLQERLCLLINHNRYSDSEPSKLPIRIPPEVWLLVLGMLDDVSLWQCTQVCQSWRELVLRNWGHDSWRKFTLNRWRFFKPLYTPVHWHAYYSSLMQASPCRMCHLHMFEFEAAKHNAEVRRNSWRMTRLRNENRNLVIDPPEGIEAAPLDAQSLHWQASIRGPDQSPYQGGTFYLQILIPDRYPLGPPVVRFLTKIFHPNISCHGDVGIDSIQHNWSLALTISKVLISIQSLLTDPYTKVCMDARAGDLYNSDRVKYELVAREWTWRYAMVDTLQPAPGPDELRLCEAASESFEDNILDDLSPLLQEFDDDDNNDQDVNDQDQDVNDQDQQIDDQDQNIHNEV